jgi:hypothetical protein
MAFDFQQYYTFRASSQYKYGSVLLSEELDSNLTSFFNWALLNVNGFTNVQSGLNPAYGGAPNRLYLVTDPGLTTGRVWQTYRKNLVWETGTGATLEPISISGVYVNGVLKTRTDPIYSHYINYRDGLVVFDSGIPTGTRVEMNYSFKNVWIDTNDSIVNQEMQFESWNVENSHWSSASSGEYYPLAVSRVQLPAIGIEVVPSRTFSPYEIGGGQWVKNKVLIHIYAERDADANRLIDLVSYQSDLRFFLYNSNTIAASGKFPLNANGDRVTGALMYPQLVRESGIGFRWKQAQILDMQVVDKVKFSTNLYGAILSTDIYVDFQEL